MNTKILKFTDIDLIKRIVENNGVVAFPTETVYGLGIRYDSFLAYKKIFEAKNRPENKSLTLMLHDIDDIEQYAIVDEKIKRVINKFMPGELTLVLPKKDDVKMFQSEKNIGIRIPDNIETIELLKGVGIPMFVTSANLSSCPAAISFDEVNEQLGDRIEAIVQGEVENKQASTVVSIVDNQVEILREGPISIIEIEGVYNT